MSVVMPVITPITPLEAGGEMFARTKTPALFDVRSSGEQRPFSIVSEATEIFDTDFEDESDFESTPQGSWESDSRRRSQTTISSYEEAQTPSPRTPSYPDQFEMQLRPVEGPRGPHLFRSSQASAEFAFEHALQMSPVLSPKEPLMRTEVAFTEDTVTPTAHQQSFSMIEALQYSDADLDDPEAHIRSWSTQQVIDWMYETGIDSSIIECFDIHDISGNVLLDLQFEDLKELDIHSFGKRHQLWNAICLLRGEDAPPSPSQTPFQDTSRPCTTTPKRSPSRSRQLVEDDDLRPTTPGGTSKRRGRKPSKTADIVTPAESVSIVAIEQLVPKPHKCAKGERCAKWRKQQRELDQLHNEHGIGRFPISPTKGGRIFIVGDPGNATTADNIVPNVHKPLQIQVEDPYRPISQAEPSAVPSSDALGPSHLPEFALHEDILNQLGARDPQDNVKQFLNFQHLQSPIEQTPPSPLYEAQQYEMFPSKSVSPFPAQLPHEQLKSLPKLDIPRSATAGPQNLTACRSATASPGTIYRLNTPATEVDVPVSAIPTGPIARDTSQSVPPNMQFRNQAPLPPRSSSRADWRRPSMTLPPVLEGEVLSQNSSKPRPSISTQNSSNSGLSRSTSTSIRDPAHHSPIAQTFGYGPDITQAGWMRKRRTKLLRHEWTDSHFRLKGTQLTQHANARLSSAAMDTINVDDYTVSCSSVASNSKLSAAMKAFSISSKSPEKKGKEGDETAFAFQLVPEGERKKQGVVGKAHHFAVKSKDERIDWMREMMLAKALQQKGKGYEVEVNGVQA